MGQGVLPTSTKGRDNIFLYGGSIIGGLIGLTLVGLSIYVGASTSPAQREISNSLGDGGVILIMFLIAKLLLIDPIVIVLKEAIIALKDIEENTRKTSTWLTSFKIIFY